MRRRRPRPSHEMAQPSVKRASQKARLPLPFLSVHPPRSRPCSPASCAPELSSSLPRAPTRLLRAASSSRMSRAGRRWSRTRSRVGQSAGLLSHATALQVHVAEEQELMLRWLCRPQEQGDERRDQPISGQPDAPARRRSVKAAFAQHSTAHAPPASATEYQPVDQQADSYSPSLQTTPRPRVRSPFFSLSDATCFPAGPSRRSGGSLPAGFLARNASG